MKSLTLIGTVKSLNIIVTAASSRGLSDHSDVRYNVCVPHPCRQNRTIISYHTSSVWYFNTDCDRVVVHGVGKQGTLWLGHSMWLGDRYKSPSLFAHPQGTKLHGTKAKKEAQ